MVLSKIDGSISYPELKKVYPEDSKMEAELYEIQVNNVDIIVAVGSAKDTFKSKGVVYYPVYLVKKNKTATQIGVYEILQSNQLRYLDNENNLDVEKLDEPLIYTFVTPTYLETKRLVPEVEEVVTKKPRSDLEEGEIDEEEEDGDEAGYCNAGHLKKKKRTNACQQCERLQRKQKIYISL